MTIHDLPAAEREDRALHLAAAAVRQPIDLAQRPLLHTHLLRLDERDHVLVLVTHQILLDSPSWGIFNQELSTLYASFCAGKHVSLPRLPIQYADFAIWQREWLQGEALEALRSYWRSQLAGHLRPLALPVDREKPAIQALRSGSQPLGLSEDVSEALKAVAGQEGVTLFAAVLAALYVLLYPYAAQEDVILFTSTSGRNRPEVRRSIGLFSNLLPLRTGLSGDPTFRMLLRRVHDTTLAAVAHQDLPNLFSLVKSEQHLMVHLIDAAAVNIVMWMVLQQPAPCCP